MTVALNVYATDGTTLIDTIETPRNIRFSDDLTAAGALQFQFSAGHETAGSGLIQADRWVKVEVDSTEVAAYVVQEQMKRRIDNDRSLVEVTCGQLRNLLRNALVWPEQLDDGLKASATRHFGWTSANSVFDHTSWTASPTHGPYSDNSLSNAGYAPAEWPVEAAAAEMIWATHDAGLDANGFGTADAGRVYFRKAFSTDESHEVIFYGSANDEVVWFMDGQEIQRSVGPYQWREFGSTPFTLPAGNHVLAAVGNNLTRPTAVGGPASAAWILGALVLADANGQPATTNETWTVDKNGATGGDFRLVFDDFAPTGPIPYNSSAATVQTALDDIIGVDKVTVTGSAGGPWTIVADAEDTGGVPHTLGYSLSGAALTGGATAYPVITNTVDGAYAEVLVKTDTTWRHLPYPVNVPGVTWGAILKTLMDEAQARGDSIDALTESFDEDTDSGSVSWADEVNLSIPVGSPIERVVAMAEDFGLDFHIDPDGVCGLWQTKGSDLTATVGLEYLTNVAGVSHARDGRRFDRLLVRTEDGFHVTVAGAPTSPQREGFLTAGGQQSADAFAPHEDALLAQYATQPDLTTVQLPGEASVVPYTDFTLGDEVLATDWQRNQVSQRVLSLSGDVDDATGAVDWTIELVVGTV